MSDGSDKFYWEQQSRLSWCTTTKPSGEQFYRLIELGCLQRIADSLESIVSALADNKWDLASKRGYLGEIEGFVRGVGQPESKFCHPAAMAQWFMSVHESPWKVDYTDPAAWEAVAGQKVRLHRMGKKSQEAILAWAKQLGSER